jgi:hypothetical protein
MHCFRLANSQERRRLATGRMKVLLVHESDGSREDSDASCYHPRGRKFPRLTEATASAILVGDGGLQTEFSKARKGLQEI